MAPATVFPSVSGAREYRPTAALIAGIGEKMLSRVAADAGSLQPSPDLMPVR